MFCPECGSQNTYKTDRGYYSEVDVINFEEPEDGFPEDNGIFKEEWNGYVNACSKCGCEFIIA